jgi:4-amino-4-deoxy-L-arabinose transferase-like glycosyltransferase
MMVQRPGLSAARDSGHAKQEDCMGLLRHPKVSGITNLERLALGVILILAAGLYLWRLDQNGFANTYYAATVRSMTLSVHNFLFASFDPAGFVSVDKPPLALWLQVASVELFGFSPLSLLLPQAVEGIASVTLIYYLVRRRFDAWAALFAALVMAITPIGVAINRYNDVDGCLVLLLLLAAWAFSVAAERGSRRYLLLAVLFASLAFNAKMLAAFVVLPVFYLVYLLGTKISLRRRVLDLSLASVPLLALSLSWVLFVDLTPPHGRPYVGSTSDNSVMSLSLGWNGFQRFLTRTSWRNAEEVSQAADAQPQDTLQRSNSRGAETGTPGPLRLLEPRNAAQVAWMLPLVLVALGFFTWKRRSRAPLSFEDQALLLWAGWFFIYLIVLSFMRGLMHLYYWLMLAPPLAALTGIGTRSLWLAFRSEDGDWKGRLFPLALLLTAIWQTYILYYSPSVEPFLIAILWLGVAISAFGYFRFRWPQRTDMFASRWLVISAAAGLVPLLAAPLFWSMTPLLEVNRGRLPEANVSLLTEEPRSREKQIESYKRLLTFLTENHHNERYLVAAENARQLAPIIIETGAPTLALGGFTGRDPILTVSVFAKMAAEHQFRYVMLSGPGRRDVVDNGPNAEIAKWVREHGIPVETGKWRLPDEREQTRGNDRDAWGNGKSRRWDRALSNTELYDLRVPPGSLSVAPVP